MQKKRNFTQQDENARIKKYLCWEKIKTINHNFSSGYKAFIAWTRCFLITYGTWDKLLSTRWLLDIEALVNPKHWLLCKFLEIIPAEYSKCFETVRLVDFPLFDKHFCNWSEHFQDKNRPILLVYASLTIERWFNFFRIYSTQIMSRKQR